MKKKICLITGSRAEYGLLYPLLKLLKKSNLFSLELIVTGMHLSPKFGLTYREIIKDGFKINHKVKINLNKDTPEGILSSMSEALSGLGRALAKLKPDLVIVLGDRFEIFCAAVASHMLRIPIAHLHGGELSSGVYDEAFRHSITKLSSLHFTSTEESRKRVIQLGEHPQRVFNVGAIGIDNIKDMKLLTRQELEKKLSFPLGDKSLLVTFHPVTLENNTAGYQFMELLKALDALDGVRIIFTKPNADTDGLIISKLIDKYVFKNRDKAVAFSSLGQLRYLSSLKYVNAVVGNSSSGIVEAPTFRIPTINIGDRQKGRLRAESVIDCQAEKRAIILAINKALSASFLAGCKEIINPYGQGDTAKKIMRIITAINPDKISLKKTFFDQVIEK